MDLSTIKSNITNAASNVKNRIQTNWKNMSTVGKVATVAATAIFAAASVAAVVFGHLGLAALATFAAGFGLTISLNTGAITGIISGVAAAMGIASLAVPSAKLLKTPETAPVIAHQEPSAIEVSPLFG